MPEPIIISEALFDKIMFIEMKRQLLNIKYERDLAEINAKMNDVLAIAGLELDKHYKINEATRSFTPVD